jgi:hypothetical protein
VSPAADPLAEADMRKYAKRVEIEAGETTNVTLEAAPDR